MYNNSERVFGLTIIARECLDLQYGRESVWSYINSERVFAVKIIARN
jgi:hypothetical protein